MADEVYIPTVDQAASLKQRIETLKAELDRLRQADGIFHQAIHPSHTEQQQHGNRMLQVEGIVAELAAMTRSKPPLL